MVGRLTLNLRMYRPEANNELTFQSMTMEFRNTRTRASATELDRNLGEDADEQFSGIDRSPPIG